MVTKHHGIACSLPVQATKGSVRETEHLDIDLFEVNATLMGKKDVLEAGRGIAAWIADESQSQSADILAALSSKASRADRDRDKATRRTTMSRSRTRRTMLNGPSGSPGSMDVCDQ